MRRALIIAHEDDGRGGEVERALVARGVACDTHLVRHGEGDPIAPWPDVSRYDLLVPMGSFASLTTDPLPDWMSEELELLADAHHRETPILGVCFGGQALAKALGGDVEVSPVTEIGWYEIQAAPGVELPVGAGPWMEWHHDRFRLPPGADLLAETASAPQLFRIGRSIGTQFHPEVDEAHLAGWLAVASDEYLASVGHDRDHLLTEARHHQDRNRLQCARLVDWFLDEIAFAKD